MRLAHLALRRGDFESARRWIESLLDSNESSSVVDRAFLVALEAHLVRGAAVEADFEPVHERLALAFQDLLENWTRRRRRGSGNAFLQYHQTRYVLGELVRLTLTWRRGERGIEESLEHLLAAQQLGTLARDLDSPTARVSLIRRHLLGPDEGMLLYFLDADHSHVFAVDARELTHARLLGRDFIEEKRSLFLDEILQSPGSITDRGRARRAHRLRQRGSELADLILPRGIRERVESWSGITVVGLDFMGYVPFEGLPLTPETLLGLEKIVSYLPSVPVGLALSAREPRRRQPGSNLRAVFVAGVPIDPALRPRYGDLPPLPFGARERAILTGAYSRVPMSLLEEGRATLAELMKQRFAPEATLTVVGHGIRDPDRDPPAGLVLPRGAGDASVVWSDQLTAIAEPSLVVLAACGTGRGPLRRGDPGVSHLGGSLLRAGPTTVVLPFANLAYRPTLELVGHFHDSLARGSSPAHALFEARKRLANEPELRDPFYHSLLHVQGLAHRPVFSTPFLADKSPSEPEWKWAPIVAALAAAGVLLWWLTGRARASSQRRRDHEPRPSR